MSTILCDLIINPCKENNENINILPNRSVKFSQICEKLLFKINICTHHSMLIDRYVK